MTSKQVDWTSIMKTWLRIRP